MQKTRNNCFGSKNCSTTLRQAKTGKHKCRNVTATLLLRVSCILWYCFQNDFQPYFKTPVCGARFSYHFLQLLLRRIDFLFTVQPSFQVIGFKKLIELAFLQILVYNNVNFFSFSPSSNFSLLFCISNAFLKEFTSFSIKDICILQY